MNKKIETQMKLITVHLPKLYIRALDRLVKEKVYPNRAEVIRLFVKDGLMREAWGKNIGKTSTHNRKT